MDEFVISIPREPTFSAVAGFVVGGIGARHDFTLDVLEDLQLALDSLLEHVEDDEGDITVELRVGERDIAVSVGPLRDETVAELERDPGAGLGLRRLLDSTVDEISFSLRDGVSWVELRKAHALAGAEG